VKAPYPTTRALAEMIRAGDAKAERYVVSVLRQNRGNVQATAAALGCSERALYNWRDSNPALTAAFAKHAMGREGAGPNAARKRQKPGGK
jgi:hypothetical protein